MSSSIKIIECPRDAMQGIKKFIPTAKKIQYINQLLEIGFYTIDFGSFVSRDIVPQLRDTKKVLEGLDISNTSSKLLAIIANIEGVKIASKLDKITYIGFPLSISEEFQRRNTNKSISESLEMLKDIQNICLKTNKILVVYISMAFGNPYNERWHPDIVEEFTEKLNKIGVSVISLSDTVGVASPKIISQLFTNLVEPNPNIEFGAHFHTNPNEWKDKIDAAYNSGCKRFDSTIKGYGGCPMAKNQLVGNMPTEKLLDFFREKGVDLGIDQTAFYNIVDKMFVYF